MGKRPKIKKDTINSNDKISLMDFKSPSLEPALTYNNVAGNIPT